MDLLLSTFFTDVIFSSWGKSLISAFPLVLVLTSVSSTVVPLKTTGGTGTVVMAAASGSDFKLVLTGFGGGGGCRF